MPPNRDDGRAQRVLIVCLVKSNDLSIWCRSMGLRSLVLDTTIFYLSPTSQVGGCLCVGCWLTLDHTTRKRRSSAIDELIWDEWVTFEKGWMAHDKIDFAVRWGRKKGGKWW